MKKLFSTRIKLLVCVLFFISAVSTVSAADKNNQKVKAVKVDQKALLGTWFWHFGYDQNQFANEQITFNKDKTFELFHLEPGMSEYDTGVYSIINDKDHGTTLLLNILKFKDAKDSAGVKVDVKIYFQIQEFSKDRLLMARYKRDFTAMGGGIMNFDPGVTNDFSKVKDADNKNLIGKWFFNKRGTPDATWEETWIFNADGTMEDIWSEGNEQSQYKGKYEVLKTKSGSVLHQIFTDPPMEFWYDLKLCRDNILNAVCTKDKMGGEEHIKNPPIENFYYRDLPLIKYTYHWENYTFYDYAPKGSDYKLLNLGKMYLFTDVPQYLLTQNLEGWTKISENEYQAKWGLKCNRNDYDPQNGNYNHEFTLPVSLLAPDMKLPAKGETIKIKLTGTVDKSINMFWGLRYVDNNDEWNVIGEDWHNVKTSGKAGNILSDVFEITLKDKPSTSDKDKIVFNLCYNPDIFDEIITISDFKFEILK